MEFYRKHFGKKLKEALNQAGMKQFQLAEKLEVNPAAVSHWISGNDFPDDSRLASICEHLKVDEEFFGFDQRELSASELLDLLQANKDILPLLPKVPKDIIKMLAKQDSVYFDHLRRTLEMIESKKSAQKKGKKDSL